MDLLVLETFRLFEPSLYTALSVRRLILTEPRNLRGYFEEEELKNRVEREISELASLKKQKSHENTISEILGILFPALSLHEDFDDSDLLRQLRLGHKAIFNRYFTLSLSNEEVAQADVDALRQNFTSPREFYILSQSLADQGKLAAVFVRLETYKTALPATAFPQIISSLIDVGDLLPSKTNPGELKMDSLTCAYRIVYFGLRHFRNEQVRFNHLKEGIIQSSGLRLVVQLLAFEERDPARGSSDFLISEELWTELKPVVVQRIRDAASDLTLKTTQDLSYILWRWKEWTSIEEVRQWLASILHTGEDALWLLRTFLSTMTSYGSKITYTRYLSLNTLAEFSNIETLSSLTQKYDLKDLRQDNMRALRAFRYAMKCKEEGKPDGYSRDHWDGENPLEEDN